MSSGFLGGGIGPTAIKRRSGLAAPVPVAGSEIIANGDMELDASWASLGTPTTNERSSTRAVSGTYSRRVVSADGFRGIYQPGKSWETGWMRWQYSAYIVDRTRIYVSVIDRDGSTKIYEGSDTLGQGAWAQRILTGRSAAVGVSGDVRFRSNNEAVEFFIDDVSAVPLSLSSLFSSRLYGSANCDLSAAITRTAGTQAGLVARLDSATSPANFIIAYLDGAGNVKVDKCVAGTYTNVISGAITYGSTKILRLVCNGNSVSAYYDGAQVGSTVTVSDAGIASNTRHGLFSTYASNAFAGYVAA